MQLSINTRHQLQAGMVYWTFITSNSNMSNLFYINEENFIRG